MSHLRRCIPLNLAAVFFLAVGCQTPKPAPTQTPPYPGTAAPPVVKPAGSTPVPPTQPVDSGAPLPEALSQKTSQFAQSVEPASTPPAKPAPSIVRWAQPHQPKAAANTPAVAPPPSTPNPRVTAIAGSAEANAMSDVPAIVPESSDFPDRAQAHAGDSLDQQIAQRMRDNPRDVVAQLDSQLLAMLEDQSSPQLMTLSALPPEDREMVAALIDGLTNFRTVVRQDNNMLLSGKIRPLLDMADRLRQQADLSVPTLALCRKVDGFGRYDPIDPPRFRAGQENPVIVYCEVENFASKLDDQKMWETQLTQEVTLFTDTGMLVWKDKTRDISDSCRNRRHDFFMYDLVRLPANLSIGRYILKVTCVDRTASRVAERTVPVEMVVE